MKIQKLQLLIMLAGLAGGMSANATTVQFVNVGPGEQVSFTSPWVGPTTANAGIYNLMVDNVATPSFCIDVADVNNNNIFTDYYYSALSAAPLSPAGPMGSTAATDIEKLWAQYYSAATVNNQDAAALQVAIWDVIAANASPSYTVTVNNNDLLDPIYGEAAAMIANLPNLTATADLVGLVGPSGDSGEQTYVVCVPEPTTTGCLLLGLGVLACFQRFAHKKHS